MRFGLWMVMLWVLGAAAACGSEGDDGGSGGSGGAGGSATGGTAGVGALGGGGNAGSAGSSATGGTGGGGDAAVPWCGGETNQQCATGEYCDYAASALCGASLQTGLCKPRPTTCTDDCPGVCGCDGKFYCNACMAQMVGVDESPDTSCITDAGADAAGDAAPDAASDAATD